MDVYLYQAALYCNECGCRIVSSLRKQGVADTGDSDDFPQGPFPDGGGEADSPQHCDSGAMCLQAEDVGGHHVGVFLENPLTSDGLAHVETALAEKPSDALVARWAVFYGIAEPAADGPPEFDDTHVETWFERDRAHVALYDDRAETILIEWWDDDVRAAIEDGFLQPRDYHTSAYAYWASLTGEEKARQ
jgi:hypothetical protein